MVLVRDTYIHNSTRDLCKVLCNATGGDNTPAQDERLFCCHCVLTWGKLGGPAEGHILACWDLSLYMQGRRQNPTKDGRGTIDDDTTGRVIRGRIADAGTDGGRSLR